jgi:MYXO-CTERM domain-containing protein
MVAIVDPLDGAQFDPDPGTGQAAIVVAIEVDDADGWGIEQTWLRIDGTDVPGSEDDFVPWEVPPLQIPEGVYTLQAVARDWAGHEGVSADVQIVVGDPPTGDSTGGDPGGSGSSTGADPGPGPTGDGPVDDAAGPDSGATDEGSSGAGPDADGGGSGCGCRTRAPTPGAGWALLALVGFRPRRRARAARSRMLQADVAGDRRRVAAGMRRVR